MSIGTHPYRSSKQLRLPTTTQPAYKTALVVTFLSGTISDTVCGKIHDIPISYQQKTKAFKTLNTMTTNNASSHVKSEVHRVYRDTQISTLSSADIEKTPNRFPSWQYLYRTVPFLALRDLTKWRTMPPQPMICSIIYSRRFNGKRR